MITALPSSSSLAMNYSNYSNSGAILDTSEFEPRPATPVKSRSSPDKKPICSGFLTPTSSSPFTPTRKFLSRRLSISPSKTLSPSTHCTPSKLILSSSTASPFHHSSLHQQPSNSTPTSHPVSYKPKFRSGSTKPITKPATIPVSSSSKQSSQLPSPSLPSLSPPSSTFSFQSLSSPVPPVLTLSQLQKLTPIRAALTAEALPRQKQLLPGAPNPSTSRILSSRPPLSPSSSSLSLPSIQPNLDHQLLPDEPPIGKARDENVLVSIRMRGKIAQNNTDHHLNQVEKTCWLFDQTQNKICEQPPNQNQSILHTQSNPPEWSFDGVFGPESPNQDVYKKSGARDLILSAMAGYDATIFAYGQTASGKTFTLTGNHHQPGIIPLSVQEIFSYIRIHPEREFLLRVSYLEIYNEQIHDLLVPPTQYSPPPIRIRQQTNGMFFAEPVREELVTSAAQVAALLIRGEKQRHVAGTDWNARSSRSHTVFGIVIESKLTGVAGAVRRSKVCLIDLAGNEKASSEVERRSEGAFINKSLLTLEKVIGALAELSLATNERKKRPQQHIPYRDSKLTQILQPSLSGESRVCVICTMNGSIQAIEESKSTLRFASRVKKVHTRAGVKEILSDKALITRYRQQIVELQNQLMEAMKKVNQTTTNCNHKGGAETKASDAVINEERLRKAAEERARIKKQLQELQSIVLNSKNIDQEEVIKRDTRPVSPVKKSNEFTEALAYNESKEETGRRQDAGKSRKVKKLEEKIDLQAYEIACLKFELSGFKRRLNAFQREPSESQTPEAEEDMMELIEKEVEESERRVAESREVLEDRLSLLAQEVEERKKFGNEVVKMLEASRNKTKRLEMFIINELDRSTRRLSKLERRPVRSKHQLSTSHRHDRRRRSSSVGTSYELHPHEESQREASRFAKMNTTRESKAETDLRPSLDDESQSFEDSDEESDEDGIEALLSIVNELPELESIRMSFGNPIAEA
ncbi:hypothetical protein O181_044327 [Austropuccinia psidii MF-1]|uniref:Kinesin-like protein n=1 Tax=Austropuccinia psidii MF-1 TaxID=1389203 RepID=A0A9Q3HHN3_9BASI|nr:hypothetical protein [Austropuccinia psidii MF-1]